MTFPPESNPLHAAIDTRLSELVAESPTVPTWLNSWMRLRPDSTEQERLVVYQAIRRSGCLPEAAGFHLVAWQADALASQRAETEFGALEERLEDIEEAHSRDEDGDWPSGAAPVEYDQLLQRYHAAWDDLFVRTLQEFGEAEMARLFQGDRERFEELSRAGQKYFHGQADPEWLAEFVEAVARCMMADDTLGPLGVRFRQDCGLWEVVVYPMPVELVGGAADGAVVVPSFSLDLLELPSILDDVVDLSWNAHGYHGSEPPFVSVEGLYNGREIFLRVLSVAPEDEEPGMKLRVRG